MAKHLTLFHTAQSHVARFETLRDRLAPGVSLTQHVRADWLARAREGMLPELLAEISATIGETTGRRLCTCTTIGNVAEAAGALRIDRPMMATAAQIGGNIALAYCLESTVDGSTALLRDAIGETGATITPVFVPQAWPHFERDDHAAFADTIASAIREHISHAPGTTVVALAQASMDVAAPTLSDLPIPVLTTPQAAFLAAIAD